MFSLNVNEISSPGSKIPSEGCALPKIVGASLDITPFTPGVTLSVEGH